MNSDTTQSIESGSTVLHENKTIIQKRIDKYADGTFKVIWQWNTLLVEETTDLEI